MGALAAGVALGRERVETIYGWRFLHSGALACVWGCHAKAGTCHGEQVRRPSGRGRAERFSSSHHRREETRPAASVRSGCARM